MQPPMFTAVIRAEECIGCSRCIPVCPVDAIVGTNKFLHTVLLDECIGCKLCIDPCPVDCIDLVPLADKLPPNTIIDKSARAIKAKDRHKAQLLRKQLAVQRQLVQYESKEQRQAIIRQEIQEALVRVRAKQIHE